MKTTTLQFFKDLTSDALRSLQMLEDEGELRAGFVDELVKELSAQRFELAKSMLAACPRPDATSTESDLRLAVSRAYYCCHHACRAALLSKFRLDFRGHADVVRRISTWEKTDESWLVVSGIISKLLDRRHLADYDPFDNGGISTAFAQKSFEEEIRLLHTDVSSVLTQVENYLRKAKVIT